MVLNGTQGHLRELPHVERKKLRVVPAEISNEAVTRTRLTRSKTGRHSGLGHIERGHKKKRGIDHTSGEGRI